jgi:hypothetical protein
MNVKIVLHKGHTRFISSPMSMKIAFSHVFSNINYHQLLQFSLIWIIPINNEVEPLIFPVKRVIYCFHNILPIIPYIVFICTLKRVLKKIWNRYRAIRSLGDLPLWRTGSSNKELNATIWPIVDLLNQFTDWATSLNVIQMTIRSIFAKQCAEKKDSLCQVFL